MAAVQTSHILDLRLEILVIWSWLPLILLMCDRLAAGERSAPRCELGQRLHRQHARAVVLCCTVVCLVDGDCSVDDFWLDRLLVNDGLNGLMHMVVDMLACSHGESGLRVVCLSCGGGVLEFGGFACETLFRLRLVVVVEFAVLDGNHVVGVLLGEDLLVLEGLHGCVVVLLVDLAVDGLSDVLMAGRLNGLRGDGWVDDFLDVGVVSVAAGELADGGFGGLHC